MGCNQILGRCGKVGESFSQPVKNRWVCAVYEVKLQILVRFIISKRTGFIFWQNTVQRKSKRTEGIQPEIQTVYFIKELSESESQTQNSSRASTPIFHSQPETHVFEPKTRTALLPAFHPTVLQTWPCLWCTTETHSNSHKGFRLAWHGREQREQSSTCWRQNRAYPAVRPRLEEAVEGMADMSKWGRLFLFHYYYWKAA